MKNSMLPESELKILGEITEKVNDLVVNHDKCPLSPELVMKSSDVEQLHIIMYMSILKDVISSVRAINGLLEMSEEEFLAEITDNGKRSITEVKRQLMMEMIADMI